MARGRVARVNWERDIPRGGPNQNPVLVPLGRVGLSTSVGRNGRCGASTSSQRGHNGVSSAAKLEVEGDRRSVARCRHWIAELLADEPLELRETVALLASEVLTNALLHARTKITVAVEANADGVRVEVCDESVLVPIRRHLGADASMGRGLLIVEKLASAWGVDPLPAGSGKL